MNLEEIVSAAQYACGVFGTPATGYELRSFPLTHDPNLAFCGIVAVVDGHPQAALTTPLDPAVVTKLSEAFVKRVEALIELNLKYQKSQKWLEDLYALEDPR